MEIPPPPQTIATSSVGSPEVEPANGVQLNKLGKHHALPFTNGVHKRHQPSSMIGFAHGKCNKNYSALVGGHVLDGCGEFMPTLASTPTDRTFLYCDACGCHRNFHSCETNHYYPPYHHVIEYQFPPHHNYHPHTSPIFNMPMSSSTPSSPSPISTYYPPAPDMYFSANPNLRAQLGSQHGNKRVRSKFTSIQKEKMKEFAEKKGWKMMKKDKEIIQGFCKDIGVNERVFKVWMNNHKNQSAENNHP